MKVTSDLKKLIEKVESGDLDVVKERLNNSDFGIFIPAICKKSVVTMMRDGQSQSESDLKITISSNPGDVPKGVQVVGWFGNRVGKDSTCAHPGGPRYCSHCGSHDGPTVNCTHPGRSSVHERVSFPVLDYDSAMQEFQTKRDMLDILARQGFGLSLLHGHSAEHKFTKLPTGYVAVISNNKTHFRTDDEVKSDESFVPNTWRFVDGELRIAGGFSAV